MGKKTLQDTWDSLVPAIQSSNKVTTDQIQEFETELSAAISENPKILTHQNPYGLNLFMVALKCGSPYALLFLEREAKHPQESKQMLQAETTPGKDVLQLAIKHSPQLIKPLLALMIKHGTLTEVGSYYAYAKKYRESLAQLIAEIDNLPASLHAQLLDEKFFKVPYIFEPDLHVQYCKKLLKNLDIMLFLMADGAVPSALLKSPELTDLFLTALQLGKIELAEDRKAEVWFKMLKFAIELKSDELQAKIIKAFNLFGYKNSEQRLLFTSYSSQPERVLEFASVEMRATLLTETNSYGQTLVTRIAAGKMDMKLEELDKYFKDLTPAQRLQAVNAHSRRMNLLIETAARSRFGEWWEFAKRHGVLEPLLAVVDSEGNNFLQVVVVNQIDEVLKSIDNASFVKLLSMRNNAGDFALSDLLARRNVYFDAKSSVILQRVILLEKEQQKKLLRLPQNLLSRCWHNKHRVKEVLSFITSNMSLTEYFEAVPPVSVKEFKISPEQECDILLKILFAMVNSQLYLFGERELTGGDLYETEALEKTLEGDETTVLTERYHLPRALFLVNVVEVLDDRTLVDFLSMIKREENANFDAVYTEILEQQQKFATETWRKALHLIPEEKYQHYKKAFVSRDPELDMDKGGYCVNAMHMSTAICVSDKEAVEDRGTRFKKIETGQQELAAFRKHICPCSDATALKEAAALYAYAKCMSEELLKGSNLANPYEFKKVQQNVEAALTQYSVFRQDAAAESTEGAPQKAADKPFVTRSYCGYYV